jgi:hypothetical protein
MASFAKMVTDAGEQYLSTLNEMQENVLKATAAYQARMAAMPTPATAPGVDKFMAAVPSPQELMDASFAFSEKLLKQQKSFTEKLLAASAPAAK